MINSVKARASILALILFVFGISNVFAADRVVVIPLGADAAPVAPTLVLKDSEGTIIGKFLGSYSWGQWYVINENGYLASIDAKGAIQGPSSIDSTVYWTGLSCTGQSYTDRKYSMLRQQLFRATTAGDVEKIFYTPSDASVDVDIFTLSKKKLGNSCVDENKLLPEAYHVYVNDPTVTGYNKILGTETYRAPLEVVME